MYCRTQLGELQQHLSELQSLGTEVWAISSTDSAGKVATFARMSGYTFPVLSDATLEVTQKYGVLNETRPILAHPTTMIIDRSGKLRYKRVDVDFVERPSAKELLDVVKTLKDGL